MFLGTYLLKFHQNLVSNSLDIADIEFLWWWGGGVGWGLHSHFYVKPNRCVEVRVGVLTIYSKFNALQMTLKDNLYHSYCIYFVNVQIGIFIL